MTAKEIREKSNTELLQEIEMNFLIFVSNKLQVS